MIYYMCSVEVSFAREEHVAELLVAYYHIYLFIFTLKSPIYGSEW